MLLEELKLKLNITWEDLDTDTKIQNIIDDAVPTLNFKLGSNITFEEKGMEHSLFMNYCMYSFNNCLADFDLNYQKEIMQLRRKYEVLNFEKQEI